MMSQYNLEDYLKLCRENKVTVLTAMPPVIHSITTLEKDVKEELGSVREIISGGGPLHRKIWKLFHKTY